MIAPEKVFETVWWLMVCVLWCCVPLAAVWEPKKKKRAQENKRKEVRNG